MADYQAIPKKNKWYHSPIVLMIIAVVCFFFASNMIGLVRKNKDTHVLKEQTSRELEELTARQQRLEEDIASLKSDRGQEEVIRENFQVTKEGEGVVVIINDESKTEPAEKKSKPFYLKIIPKKEEPEF